MSSNKTLFLEVLGSVSTFFESEGFVSHPVYASGWEPANQAYEASLIRLGPPGYIDQLNVNFSPSSRAFRIFVNRSKNSLGIDDLDDIVFDAHTWTESWLYSPFDEYLLMSGSAWNTFSIRNNFRLDRRRAANLHTEAQRLAGAIIRNSRYLIDALRGNYRGRLVAISHYDIKRPDI